MRVCSILCIACAITLNGCGSSEPQARRGEVAPAATDTAPAPTDTAPAPTDTAPATEKATSAEPGPVATADSEGKGSDESGELQLDKLTFAVPEGWQRKQASSSFVLAEFALPKAEGADADGRLTVSVAGGSVEANVERWRDQFGGKPEPATEKKQEINGLEVSLVDFGGEFNDQRGPFAPATKRADYRMLAAIIPVDGELHFVKAVGPQATMAAHAERFQKFVESVKKK